MKIFFKLSFTTRILLFLSIIFFLILVFSFEKFEEDPYKKQVCDLYTSENSRFLEMIRSDTNHLYLNLDSIHPKVYAAIRVERSKIGHLDDTIFSDAGWTPVGTIINNYDDLIKELKNKKNQMLVFALRNNDTWIVCRDVYGVGSYTLIDYVSFDNSKIIRISFLTMAEVENQKDIEVLFVNRKLELYAFNIQMK